MTTVLRFVRDKKVALIFLLLSLGFSGYSQIRFESGYFIDSTGQKIECLIKNNDWKHNPQKFKYKLSEQSEVKTGTLESVQEFSIYGHSTYISRLVKIDRSGTELKNMDFSRQPVFEEERLFLKVLVRGKANLYSYEEARFSRYFYNVNQGRIEQLIYKPFRTSDSKIAENNAYRQQLMNDLDCPQFSIDDFDELEYSRRALVKLFTAYSRCHEAELVNLSRPRSKEKKDIFNLTLRPGLRYSSLEINNRTVFIQPMDYGDQLGWRLGLEAELVLPFNRNKWAVLIEPTYQYFKSGDLSISAPGLFEGKYMSNVQYESVELPIALRHYFFLSDRSKIYVNVSYVMDFSFDSHWTSHRMDGSMYYSAVSLSSRPFWGVGAGFKYLNRYSIELQYQKERDLFSEYIYWNSNYKQVSLVLGFTFL